MCQKRIFCRNHIRGLAALAAGLFLFTGSPQARAEESQPTPVPEYIRTADEIVIDDRYDELSAYSITFRNMQAYTPECFNYAKVTAAEELPAADGREMNRYRFADDAVLTIPCSTTLEYGNKDYECYRQLLNYMDNAGAAPGRQVNAPYPLDSAMARCEAIFKTLHIENLVLDEAVALPADAISGMTEGMKAFYNETEPVCFDAVPEEIGVWYLAFRQELNGIKSLGTPQVRIALTEMETALLEMDKVIDHINDDYELESGVCWLDAIRVFSASHCEKTGGESYEISRIRLAYDYDLTDSSALDARAFPCWQIEGRGPKAGLFKEVYSIPEGKKKW